MSNNMTSLEIVQSKLPSWYKKYKEDNSIMYAVLEALVRQLDVSNGNIDRIDAMIGIDTTYDEDLEYRWGSLLNMPKSPNESYDDYRYKLMMTYSAMMNGGTEEAIKFAIAAILGIDRRNENIDKYIHIYDVWDYKGHVEGYDGGYGGFVCVIDFRICEGALNYYKKINDAIDRVKVSGVKSYLVVIYISSEDDVALKHIEDILDSISVSDNEDASVSHSDIYSDNISYTFNDSVSIYNNALTLWSSIGTNSYTAVLNSSMVTNMFMEEDECIDIITYK